MTFVLRKPQFKLQLSESKLVMIVKKKGSMFVLVG